jgi:hypothetical protein
VLKGIGGGDCGQDDSDSDPNDKVVYVEENDRDLETEPDSEGEHVADAGGVKSDTEGIERDAGLSISPF